MWTSSSTMAGGGVSGKDVGIARGTMVQVGATIETFHLFIREYLQAGGMITRISVGEGISGTTSEYLTNKFNGTGRDGKITGIGRSNKLGVSRVCNPERRLNHSTRGNNKKTIKEASRKT
jgi:hypothetical protein